MAKVAEAEAGLTLLIILGGAYLAYQVYKKGVSTVNNVKNKITTAAESEANLATNALAALKFGTALDSAGEAQPAGSPDGANSNIPTPITNSSGQAVTYAQGTQSNAETNRLVNMDQSAVAQYNAQGYDPSYFGAQTTEETARLNQLETQTVLDQSYTQNLADQSDADIAASMATGP